jgi:hypothetical protein
LYQTDLIRFAKVLYTKPTTAVKSLFSSGVGPVRVYKKLYIHAAASPFLLFPYLPSRTLTTTTTNMPATYNIQLLYASLYSSLTITPRSPLSLMQTTPNSRRRRRTLLKKVAKLLTLSPLIKGFMYVLGIQLALYPYSHR